VCLIQLFLLLIAQRVINTIISLCEIAEHLFRLKRLYI